MVKIVFFKKNDQYVGFTSVGHAGFDEINKDIVCSAISAVLVGGLNALTNVDSFNINIEKGNVECLPIKEVTNEDTIVLKTIRIQLESIKKSASNYISIKEERMN